MSEGNSVEEAFRKKKIKKNMKTHESFAILLDSYY